MCIAILNKANGANLSRKTLRRCQAANPDGIGIAWTEDGTVKVKKSVKSLDVIFKTYQRARTFDTDILLHFRLATHGQVSVANCHPFNIDSNTVVIHNGIIDGFGSDDLSDTLHFTNHILRGLPEGWRDNQAILDLLGWSIAWSKLVILSGDGKVTIVNEDDGLWQNGNWYSNDSFQRGKKKGKKSKWAAVGNRSGSCTWRGEEWADSDLDDLNDHYGYLERTVGSPISKVRTTLPDPLDNGVWYDMEGVPYCEPCAKSLIGHAEYEACEVEEWCVSCGHIINPHTDLVREDV